MCFGFCANSDSSALDATTPFNIYRVCLPNVIILFEMCRECVRTNKFNNENTTIIMFNVVRPFYSVHYYNIIHMDGWIYNFTPHLSHTQCSNISYFFLFNEINAYCVLVFENSLAGHVPLISIFSIAQPPTHM